jgi:hypothetical protein
MHEIRHGYGGFEECKNKQKRKQRPSGQMLVRQENFNSDDAQQHETQ